MAIWGHFGLFQSPPMALPDGFKGSNTSVWMYPTQIQPRSRQYHQFGASKDDYIQQYPFWPIWGPPGAPQAPKSGPSRKKMWALCSSIITNSIKTNETVSAMKKNHGTNVSKYWLTAHCASLLSSPFQGEFTCWVGHNWQTLGLNTTVKLKY